MLSINVLKGVKYVPETLVNKISSSNKHRLIEDVYKRQVQDGAIEQMIFPIPRLISHISRFAALEEGDIISTGTPQGVGEIKAGDLLSLIHI